MIKYQYFIPKTCFTFLYIATDNYISLTLSLLAYFCDILTKQKFKIEASLHTKLHFTSSTICILCKDFLLLLNHTKCIWKTVTVVQNIITHEWPAVNHDMLCFKYIYQLSIVHESYLVKIVSGLFPVILCLCINV